VSLSDDLRRELAAIEPRAECDRLAELSGLFHTAGSAHLRGRGEVSVHLDVGSSAVARRAFSILRSFDVDAEIRTYTHRSFERSTRYQLHVRGEGRTLQLLNEAGILDANLAPLEVPPKRVVGRPCCRSSYLRGVLLGGASLSGPRAPHLEVRVAGRAGAQLVAEVAAGAGARLKVLDRGRHAIAYAKGAEQIGAVLASAGAGSAVLSLEERSVLGATRARANRLANADHANIVRSSRAAHRQLLAVRRLAASGSLDDLPAPLREAAQLRLLNPSSSLRELAAKCRPRATKAALHRRLNTLIRLAEL
jgi:cell division protein WhiA